MAAVLKRACFQCRARQLYTRLLLQIIRRVRIMAMQLATRTCSQKRTSQNGDLWAKALLIMHMLVAHAGAGILSEQDYQVGPQNTLNLSMQFPGRFLDWKWICSTCSHSQCSICRTCSPACSVRTSPMSFAFVAHEWALVPMSTANTLDRHAWPQFDLHGLDMTVDCDDWFKFDWMTLIVNTHSAHFCRGWHPCIVLLGTLIWRCWRPCCSMVWDINTRTRLVRLHAAILAIFTVTGLVSWVKSHPKSYAQLWAVYLSQAGVFSGVCYPTLWHRPGRACTTSNRTQIAHLAIVTSMFSLLNKAALAHDASRAFQYVFQLSNSLRQLSQNTARHCPQIQVRTLHLVGRACELKNILSDTDS